MLEIYAGSQALRTIKEQGLHADLFDIMLGASGGPKWFTLFGLDKYLFGEFFKDRASELNLIGSSAGAFRFAALAQQQPVEAISKLAKHYSETVYSKNANAAEVTEKAEELLQHVYGSEGITQLLSNDVIKPHFIVAKCHGLTASENKIGQLLGLASSMALNKCSRRLLNWQYQRFVFHHPKSQLQIDHTDEFTSHYVSLNQSNLHDALLASGSIPLVMKGVKNIAGAPNGMYRDGGIIDYHFDFSFNSQQKLTLYPHFNHLPKPGWFDKNSQRVGSKANYDNVVMLVPSAEFIGLLPFNKIPDRTDFTEMTPEQRIPYWQTVLQETHRLADAFAEIVTKQEVDEIKPLPFE